MDKKESLLKQRDEAKKRSSPIREPGEDFAEQAEGRGVPRPEPPPNRTWRNSGGCVPLHHQHGR